MTTAPQTAMTTFLQQEAGKELIRISTAGSVDDGKSTLIGRLLHDTANIHEDTWEQVTRDSATHRGGDQIDFALLTDGLKSEREQGITIDVAYRYFATARRKFILADTPGHEQYTRNMATGASTANIAVVLVDARKGLRPQSKRHAFIASLLGIPHMIVAVNKMDLVDWDEAVFNEICKEFTDYAARLSIKDLRFIPMSALLGDNVVQPSENTPWYQGETLLHMLEHLYVAGDRNLVDLRFPVQYVIRPNQDFRGYAGPVLSGMVRPGGEVRVLPSNQIAYVQKIHSFDGPLEEAFPPMSVTLTLDREVDVSRGDMLVHTHNLPRRANQFEAMCVWMDDMPLDRETRYLLKHTCSEGSVMVSDLRYRLNVESLKRESAESLAVNEIGRLVLHSDREICFDSYEKNRETGHFVLIHPLTHRTVAAGMIINREPEAKLPATMPVTRAAEPRPALRRGGVPVAEKQARAALAPITLWLTGLVGSGKQKVALGLERALFDAGRWVTVLDGKTLRRGLSRELGFTNAGVAENLRRAAETARLFNDTGVTVVAAFVSPLQPLRAQVQQIVGPERFIEVHVDAGLASCEARDEEQLYQGARRGWVTNLAGIDQVYEPPTSPAVHLDMDRLTTREAVQTVLTYLHNLDTEKTP
ncbi:sulfate adenylyltransferase subunit CysN [Acanthopleuribacter pedis]|uniref:Sulfate adenylyltransferase subunit 1 n=1 Tax=Acanthopleuribacter pedis TaxID=442870 RepID=A0A8J7U657_9BACT|nr:sulfate adenylyltransferase subunit CysN [Acanthopleuribacter pedis]MBO1321554.1 sulfate adenylyltransferase subunit CysN [Acanthopleuribacter pedis]